MRLAFRLLAGRYKVTCQPGSHTKDAQARRAWGCDAPTQAPVFPDPSTGAWDKSESFDLHRCPACQVGREWTDFVNTWLIFGGTESRGPLPVAGGWIDQTQWFADAHQILAVELNKYHEAARKEAEAKRGKRG
jgi:hypothetical protein